MTAEASVPTLAADLWQQLTKRSIPPFIALEILMEAGEGCDRPKALAMLRRAAAKWVRKARPNKEWPNTMNEVARSIRQGSFDRSIGCLQMVRDYSRNYPENHDSPCWLTWCDSTECAIAILRDLTSIP